MSYIEFSDFRCYHYKRYDLPEDGLLLLHGPSGSGKSTIPEGFSYALTGKVTKTASFGKTSSKVILFLKGHNILITRISRPRQLLVTWEKVEYEDECAQEIINSVVCTLNQFMYGCYIKQKSSCSLVTMTPAEQLEFVQAISFDDKKVQIKNNIKTLLQQYEKDEISLKGKVEVTSSSLQGSEGEEEEDVDDPLLGVSVEEMRESVATMDKKLRTSKKTYRNTIDAINSLEHTQRLQEDLEKEQDILDGMIKADPPDVVEETKKKYKLVLELEKQEEVTRKNKLLEEENIRRIDLLEEEIEKAEKEIEEMNAPDTPCVEKAKEYIQKYDKYCDLEEELDDCKVLTKIQDPTEDLEALLSYKNEFESKIQAQNKMKAKYEKMYKSVKTLIPGIPTKALSTEELYTSITEYLSKNSEVFECPGCACHIEKKRGEYHTTKEDIREETIDEEEYEKLVEYKAQIKDFTFESVTHEEVDYTGIVKLKKVKEEYLKQVKKEEKVLVIQEKMDALEDFSKEVSTYEELIKSSELAEKIIFSHKKTIKSNKVKILSLEKLLPPPPHSSENEEVEPGTIEELKKELVYQSVKQYLDNQTIVNRAYNKQIFKVDSYDQGSIPDNIPSLLLKLTEKKASTEININRGEKKILQQNNNILKHIEVYMPYLKRCEMRETHEGYKEELVAVTRKLKCIYILREKCKQAEFLSIEKTVENINIQSKFYLDRMFPNDPMEVTLENYKPKGKGKNAVMIEKMNMSIYYNNNEYDSVSQLSGGERDRVNLAFILAVNDLIGSKMLFLDECLSSLDSNTNTDVFLFLKKHTEGRLIVAISHEAVTGIFDKTITITKERRGEVVHREEGEDDDE